MQAPALDTNVSPGGVGSLTETSVAASGPLLVTTRVYTTLVPGVAEAGPVLEMPRSVTNAVSAVDAVLVLLAGVGSVTADETVAVFTIGSGVE